MDPLTNRKRPAESDNEEDVVNKKQQVDSLDSSDVISSNTDEQDHIAFTNEEAKIELTATTSTTDDTTVETQIPYPYLVMLNVEVTCDENPANPAAVQVTKENAEIIQLSFAIVKSSNMELIKKHTINVKPERTPITAFCTQVNGITPDMVESAGTLKEAIDTLDKIIQTEILDKDMDFCFVTHGGWVLRIQLSREARDKKLDLPSYLSQPCMFDLKQEIQRWHVHHPEVQLLTTNIKELCDTFKVPVIRKENGTDLIPSNIDVPATTIGIVHYLVTNYKHDDVFVHPIDTSADLQQFKKEESKVVHLAGLPAEVTQGELDAWFSSNGLRPTTMWMMQSSDQLKPSVSGFVVFTQHDDAIRALLLNGRCLSDRVIEVSASSERVVEAAINMLSPFPLQSKVRQIRPGDWNCPNCSFHNFASRRNCFRCNAENTASPSTVTGVPAPLGGGGSSTTVNTSSTPYNSAGAHLSNGGGPNVPSPSSVTPITSAQPYTYSPGQQQQQHHHHAHGAPHAASYNQGDWACPNSSCNFHNYSSRLQCMKCGTHRPGVGGPPSHIPPSNNTGYNPHHHYHAPRPHHAPNFRPGDWYCPNPACGFQNFASRMSCYKCHTPNPSPSAPQSSYGGPPGNASSGGHGSYGYDASAGGASYGGNGYGSGYASLPPGNMMAPGTGGHGFRAGDWYCPSCNSHNFASRFQCLKCHTAKPYNPTQPNPPPMYGGTPGGFRPGPPMKNGDWVCRNSGCGFHNFAKRTHCGKCNAPNPEPSSYMAATEY
ncbi:hypothetical protein BC941DRAFT_410376 [Chlamydoabsidia padenii]|nr:hypothetical protein BC941DRAFT_410376 [Chlamydoabsidia padenii]